jgi:hypothetical protein
MEDIGEKIWRMFFAEAYHDQTVEDHTDQTEEDDIIAWLTRNYSWWTPKVPAEEKNKASPIKGNCIFENKNPFISAQKTTPPPGKCIGSRRTQCVNVFFAFLCIAYVFGLKKVGSRIAKGAVGASIMQMDQSGNSKGLKTLYIMLCFFSPLQVKKSTWENSMAVNRKFTVG